MQLPKRRPTCCDAKWTIPNNPYRLVCYALVSVLSRRRYNDPLEMFTVVDVGCNDGFNISLCANHLLSHGILLHTIGIDQISSHCDETAERLDEFVLADATKIDGYNEVADVVSCIHVNATNHHALLSVVARFLKPGGLLAATVPMPSVFYRLERLQTRMPKSIYERMMPMKDKWLLLTKSEIENNT